MNYWHDPNTNANTNANQSMYCIVRLTCKKREWNQSKVRENQINKQKNWCIQLNYLSEFLYVIMLRARAVFFKFIIIVNGCVVDVNMIAVAMVAIRIIGSCDRR